MLLLCLIATGCGQHVEVSQRSSERVIATNDAGDSPVVRNEPAATDVAHDKDPSGIEEPPDENKEVQGWIAKLEDRDPKVRSSAVQALRQMGPKARSAIPALVRALGDEQSWLSESVASALGEMGPSAVPPLIAALKDKNPKVRTNAALALAALGPQAEAAVPALVVALNDDGLEVRRCAARALGEIGPAAIPAIPVLIETFKQPVEAGGAAAQAVGKMGPSAVAPLLVALKDKDSNVRWCAAAALGGIAQRNRGPEIDKALPYLLACSKDSDKYVRAEAMKASGNFRATPKSAVPVLLAQLRVTDKEVRQAAAAALGEFGPEAKAAVPALIQLFRSPDYADRVAAGPALRKIDPEAFKQVLAEDKAKRAVIMVPVDASRLIQLSSRRPIINVNVAERDVVHVSTAINDQRNIVLRGIAPGKTGLTLAGEDNIPEEYEVMVCHEVNVALGVNLSWLWPEKRPIKKVAVDDGKVGRIQLDNREAGAIAIEPLAEGLTMMTLTDSNGKTERVALRVKKPNHMITVGETIKLQVRSKKPLHLVYIQNGSVLDPVLNSLTGTITDSNGFPANTDKTPIAERKEINLIIRDGTSPSVEVKGTAPGLTMIVLHDETRTGEEPIWIGVKARK
jgi:HEAT repeat protein